MIIKQHLPTFNLGQKDECNRYPFLRLGSFHELWIYDGGSQSKGKPRILLGFQFSENFERKKHSLCNGMDPELYLELNRHGIEFCLCYLWAMLFTVSDPFFHHWVHILVKTLQYFPISPRIASEVPSIDLHSGSTAELFDLLLIKL